MEYYNYQDPNTAYGYGYEGYGYGESEYTPESQEPPPPPDKNWEDPMKTNKEYVRKLQKMNSFVHKGFEALRQESVFLLEVQVESFALIKDIIQVEDTSDKQGRFHLTQVQFWKLPFTEVNGIGATYGDEHEHKRRSITRQPNFSQLFQEINSLSFKKELEEKSRDEDNKTVDETDAGSFGFDKESSLISARKSEGTIKESSVNEDDEKEEEMDECVVMKGTSVMVGMTGFKMIQTLQMNPIKVRVVKVELSTNMVEDENSTTDEDTDAEEVESTNNSLKLSVAKESLHIGSLKSREVRVETIVAESSIIIPEVLQEAVLKGNFASDSGTYNLTDSDGERVGKVKVTISVKCYGSAVINCMNRWGYDHTILMTCDPSKEDTTEEEMFVPELDNVLLRNFNSKQKSAQMLQKCLEEESKKRKCRWYDLARDCLPPCPIPESTSMEDLEKQEMDRELAWRKLKQICRQLKGQEPRKNSLYDRLEDVRMSLGSDDKIQTGMAILDVNNPFEEEANMSIVTEISSGSKKRRSTKTSTVSSNKRDSKRVSIQS